MKIAGKSEGSVIDRLLKAELRRAAAQAACQGFDPDMAAAYLERSLSGAETNRYESHLGECPVCRKGVVQLSRQALAETGRTSPSLPQQRTLPQLISGLLTTLAQPRWALAATALLAVAVAVPVLLSSSRQEENLGAAKLAAESPRPSTAQPGDVPAPEAAEFRSESAVARRGSVERVNRSEERGRFESGQATGPTPVAPASTVANVSQPAAPESRSQQAQKAESGGRVEKDAPTQVAAALEQQEPKKLDRIDEKKALSLSEEGAKVADTRVLRPGVVTDQPKAEKEKTATIRPDDAMVKAPESRAGAYAVGTKSPAEETDKRADRDVARSRAAEPAAKPKPTGASKVVAKKRFRLIDGVWTDNDYKADKEMPAVTLIWGSDVFKEEVSKQPALKTYLSEFNPSERVIIVYKGTAYKIEPREK